MRATNRFGKISIEFLLRGLMVVCCLFIVPKVSAQTYDFDEGLEAVTEGLVSENSGILKNKKVAVFGIIESKSGEKWLISSHIEDGIVDALVNNGCRVIERRRIQDVIKKEIKETTDLWFDQDQAAQFGKLVGADFVVTGNYVLWGQGMLKISIRAINVADGEIVAADKVKILTDRIANLLKSEEDGKHPKETDVGSGKSVAEPTGEESKTTLAVNANVTDAKVLVDGKEMGLTPMSDVTVSPGERKITVKKQGYELYQKTIHLGKGRAVSLYVDLHLKRTKKERSYVEVKPDDATVKTTTKHQPEHPKTENRSIRCSKESILVKHEFLGACGFANKSQFTLAEGRNVSRIRIWYYTPKGGGALNVNIVGPNGYSWSGLTSMGNCQGQWCEGIVNLNQCLGRGTYSVAIDSVSMCKNPNGLTTLVVYGCTESSH